VTCRLLPLQLSTLCSGMMLWLPVEKLFMTEIGFTPASVGLMAGVYAIVVPLLEIPSGLLADRWSRKGVMIVATLALAASVGTGATAHSVAAYVLSALCLGVFIAMHSGTVDSIIYDTLIEHGADLTQFPRLLGRLGGLSSATLVGSSLLGGWLASVWSPRDAYLATLPFVALSLVCLAFVHEPQLQRETDPAGGGRRGLRAQARDTFATILARRHMRALAMVMALSGLLVQMVIEFGPLWLVELRSTAESFGPFSAAVLGALGLGGFLVGHVDLHRRSHRLVGSVIVLGACVVIATVHNAMAVTLAMTAMPVTLAVAQIQLTSKLHDASDSSVRAGVSSSVSTLSFLIFLPISIAFGFISQAASVYRGGLLIATVAVITVLLLNSVFRDDTFDSAPDPVSSDVQEREVE
jgi:MFS family permease